MTVRVSTLSGVMLLAAAMLCAAQEAAKPQQTAQEPKSDQPKVERPHGARPEGMLQLLVKELNLDEAQQTQVKAFLDEHRSREKDIRTSTQLPAELQEKTAKVRQEMMQARKAGDTARVTQLREELAGFQREREDLLKPVRAKLDESQEVLHGQILGILKDDQKAKFLELWDEQLSMGDGYGGPVRSPRALKSSVEKVAGVTPDQKKQIEAVFEQFRRASREPAASGLKARKDLITKLYDDVSALLSPEQKEQLQKVMEGERGLRKGELRPPKSEAGGPGPKPAEGTPPPPPPPQPAQPPAH
jgi:Spy/CpxP family protein refolding chaperone